MCGITAIITFNDKVDAKNIELMNNQLKHRGPDDEGYLIINNANGYLALGGKDTKFVNSDLSYIPTDKISKYDEEKILLAFGHRRLSIVDLSVCAHQPLSVDNDDYWIIYNGEVYNHLEIRQELETLGYKFNSHSDTEVILRAYSHWQEKCLDKFNGMFAFLILDKKRKQVFIARDRFGVKPLYYYQNETGIYFASEIKAFTVLPQWQANLNHQRAYDFLVNGLLDHTEETLFVNVKQLRGGEYALIDLLNLSDLQKNGLLKHRWYYLEEKKYKNEYQTACKDFKNMFIDAVKLRLRSDVTVGSCLSGGLDSSAIVTVINQIHKEGNNKSLQSTFSAYSSHKEFDEREYINEVAKENEINDYYCEPSLENLFAVNDKITWYQDEPFGSTSIYAQWSVFELVKEKNIKVMLDGQGADELLAGYQGLYFQVYLNELFHQGKFIKFIKEAIKLKEIYAFKLKALILKSIFSLIPRILQNLIGKVLGKKQYKLDWINKNKLDYFTKNIMVSNSINEHNVQDLSYKQLIYSHLPMLLHWEDRDSMVHSVESRVPFVDYRLVELAYSMPSSYKINKGISKRILRDSLDGILPDKIKNRISKLGFVTPEEIWLKNNKDLFRQKLLEALDASGGIFNKTQVILIFEEIVNGSRKFDFWIWRLISFGTWMRVFKVYV